MKNVKTFGQYLNESTKKGISISDVADRVYPKMKSELNIDNFSKVVKEIDKRWEGPYTDPYEVRDLISNALDAAREMFSYDKLTSIVLSLNESVLNEAKTIKWKPSQNNAVDGYTSKSFPYNKGDGDMYVKQDKLHKKWKTRLESWLGFEVEFPLDTVFFKKMMFDFKFTDKDGILYRVYHSGDGAKSMSFVVQKFKKGIKESVNKSDTSESLKVDGHIFDIIHPNGNGGGLLKAGKDGILYDDKHFISWEQLEDIENRYK